MYCIIHDKMQINTDFTQQSNAWFNYGALWVKLDILSHFPPTESSVKMD